MLVISRSQISRNEKEREQRLDNMDVYLKQELVLRAVDVDTDIFIDYCENIRYC